MDKDWLKSGTHNIAECWVSPTLLNLLRKKRRVWSRTLSTLVSPVQSFFWITLSTVYLVTANILATFLLNLFCLFFWHFWRRMTASFPSINIYVDLKLKTHTLSNVYKCSLESTPHVQLLRNPLKLMTLSPKMAIISKHEWDTPRIMNESLQFSLFHFF